MAKEVVDMEEYVKKGEKVNMMTEMVPLIEVSTGRIISWQVLRSFRVNTPRQKQEKKREKLQVEKEESEEL